MKLPGRLSRLLTLAGFTLQLARWRGVAIRQRIAEERLDLGGRRDEGRDRTTAGGGRCPPPTPTLRRLDGVRPGQWRIVVERP